MGVETETGDKRQEEETGDGRPETGDRGPRTEDRGLKTEGMKIDI